MGKLAEDEDPPKKSFSFANGGNPFSKPTSPPSFNLPSSTGSSGFSVGKKTSSKSSNLGLKINNTNPFQKKQDDVKPLDFSNLPGLNFGNSKGSSAFGSGDAKKDEPKAPSFANADIFAKPARSFLNSDKNKPASLSEIMNKSDEKPKGSSLFANNLKSSANSFVKSLDNMKKSESAFGNKKPAAMASAPSFGKSQSEIKPSKPNFTHFGSDKSKSFGSESKPLNFGNDMFRKSFRERHENAKKSEASIFGNDNAKNAGGSLFGNDAAKKTEDSIFGNDGAKKTEDSIFGNDAAKKTEGSIFGDAKGTGKMIFGDEQQKEKKSVFGEGKGVGASIFGEKSDSKPEAKPPGGIFGSGMNVDDNMPPPEPKNKPTSSLFGKPNAAILGAGDLFSKPNKPVGDPLANFLSKKKTGGVAAKAKPAAPFELKKQRVNFMEIAEPPKSSKLEQNRKQTGTCTEMCPPHEIDERIDQMDVNPLEKINGQRDRRKFVKRYRRAGAGEEQDYSLIRTPKACLKSLHYMMDEVLDRKDEDFGQIYSFISDRLRAVFKDLSVQHCKNEFYAEANEISARFRILSDFICKGSEFELKGSFVTLHNNEKLQESFSNLEHYDNDNPSVNRKNRKETIMLNIAFEIGNGNPSKMGAAIKKWGSAPERIRTDPDMKKMSDLFNAISHCNFAKFLQVYNSLPLLVKMTLHNTLNWMRMKMMERAKNIKFGEKDQEVSKDKELANILQFHLDEDFERFYAHYQIYWNQNDRPRIVHNKKKFLENARSLLDDHQGQSYRDMVQTDMYSLVKSPKSPEVQDVSFKPSAPNPPSFNFKPEPHVEKRNLSVPSIMQKPAKKAEMPSFLKPKEDAPKKEKKEFKMPAFASKPKKTEPKKDGAKPMKEPEIAKEPTPPLLPPIPPPEQRRITMPLSPPPLPAKRDRESMSNIFAPPDHDSDSEPSPKRKKVAPVIDAESEGNSAEDFMLAEPEADPVEMRKIQLATSTHLSTPEEIALLSTPEEVLARMFPKRKREFNDERPAKRRKLLPKALDVPELVTQILAARNRNSLRMRKRRALQFNLFAVPPMQDGLVTEDGAYLMKILGCQSPDLFEMQRHTHMDVEVDYCMRWASLYQRVFAPTALQSDEDCAMGFQGMVFMTKACLHSTDVGPQLRGDQLRLAKSIKHVKPLSLLPLAVIVQTTGHKPNHEDILLALKLDGDYYEKRIRNVLIFEMQEIEEDGGADMVEWLAHESPKYPELHKVVMHDFLFNKWERERAYRYGSVDLAKAWNAMIRDVMENFSDKGFNPDVSWPPGGFQDSLEDRTMTEHDDRKMIEMKLRLEESLLPDPKANEEDLQYGFRLESSEQGLMLLDTDQIPSVLKPRSNYDPATRVIWKKLLTLASSDVFTEPAWSFWEPQLQEKLRAPQKKSRRRSSGQQQVVLFGNEDGFMKRLASKFSKLRTRIKQHSRTFRETQTQFRETEKQMEELI